MHPQQPMQPPPMPPKKRMSKEAKIGWFAFGGLAALAVVVSALTSNTATDTTSPTIATSVKPNGPSVACADQENRNTPCPVQVGKPFQLGKHEVLAGWTIAKDELDLAAMTGKAQNKSDQSSSMLIELKFLRGNEVVMDVSCSTDQLDPGQIQAMSCFSGDNYTTAYDRVTAQATF